MKNTQTIAGKIIALDVSDTRYGARAQAKVESIDFSTGEVTEATVIAWKDDALDLKKEGLGKEVGLSGYWKKDSNGSPSHFNATSVSNLRIIDPATFDASKYL